jgi:sugar/nucleoside kinase (ribokinase family)
MFELPKVLEALEHADYIFGNEDEAAEFAKT